MTSSFHPETVAGTTRFIARSLLVASHEPRFAGLFSTGSDAFQEPFLPAAGDRIFVQLTRHRIFRAAFLWAVGSLLPGILPHYLARKRCLEDFLRGACGAGEPPGAGCRQVVVLGAGLDAASWRLGPQFPAVRFIEVDRSPALRVKEQAMAAAGTNRANLTFLPGDLGDESLDTILGRCPVFDPTLSTFFLAEGLLMYLVPERVVSLLGELAALGGVEVPKSLGFTFMEARSEGGIGFRRSSPLVKWWMRRQGEPFRWAHSPETLDALLEGKGWLARELISSEDLRTRYLDPAGLHDEPLAVGEWLALAQTKEGQ